MVIRNLNRDIEITHFGNDTSCSGGISSVIRRHLRRCLADSRISAISTYDSRKRTLFAKSSPIFRAVIFVLFTRNFDVAHVHMSNRGSILREGLVLVAARLTRRRCIVTLHGSGIVSMDFLSAFLYRYILKFAHVVHGYADFYRFAVGVPPERWMTLPNDVFVKAQVDLEGKRNVAVFVGEVGYRKGIDLLLEAWKECDENGWQLFVVGPIAGEVADLISADRLPSSISVWGPQAHEQVLEIFERSALVVLPSRAEAFPMTVCEAMAAGCAIVGSDAGAMGELLDDAGQAVVRPLDALSLSVALNTFFTSPTLVRQRGANAHSYALSNLSEMAVRTSWERAYDLPAK